MAEIANTLWYRLGTITVTDGSTKVTGVGTHFTTAGINPGATLRVDGRPYAYEVKRVVSDTELELAAAYYGGTVSSSAYSIDRNFQSTTNAKLAADVTDLIRIYEQVRNGTVTTIEGKSAYQVAVANGYVGTEAQWLASLKGNAEEISVINTKLDRIYTDNAAAHNGIYRGKNLGTSITAAQIAAIKAGTFEDLYIGDYWNLNINGINTQAIIAGFDTYLYYAPNTGGHVNKHHVVIWFSYSWQNPTWTYPINETATCEGHIYNSKMFSEYLPEILSQINAHISLENIVYMYDLVADAINSSGAVSHRVAVEKNRIFLPSAYNLTGINYNTDHTGWMLAGLEAWPRSRFLSFGQTGSMFSWLSENANSTHWRRFYNSGNYVAFEAANTHTQFSHVKPFILLGEAQS